MHDPIPVLAKHRSFCCAKALRHIHLAVHTPHQKDAIRCQNYFSCAGHTNILLVTLYHLITLSSPRQQKFHRSPVATRFGDSHFTEQSIEKGFCRVVKDVFHNHAPSFFTGKPITISTLITTDIHHDASREENRGRDWSTGAGLGDWHRLCPRPQR